MDPRGEGIHGPGEGIDHEKAERAPRHQIPKIPLIQLCFEEDGVGLLAGFLNDNLIAR